MSNPTSNFGWQMPTPTDLVTDLPADFEVFGQAVDSSMADLKGGTSGQILSKNSNTDMDFVWITNDQGDITAVTAGTGISGGGTSGAVTITNSMATEIAAKGDLIVGTGSQTFDNLTAGANGETLVADSSTATGLRYQVPVNVNPTLNSAFQIWQRGTTSPTTDRVYTADRWQKGSGTNYTHSRQVTGDTTNLPFIQYCLRAQRTASSSSTTAVELGSSFESVNSIPYAGRTVTMSFYARAGANYSATSSLLLSQLWTGTSTDGNLFSGTLTAAATPLSSNVTLTTTWQRFTITGTLASTTTQIVPYFTYTPTGTAGANDFFDITGVQIEVGSVATPFKTYAGTIQGELAACRYYYRRNVATGNAYGSVLGFSTIASGTTAASATWTEAPMRAIPTSVDFANIALADTSGASAISAVALSGSNTLGIPTLIFTSSGLTQFRPYFVVGNNNAAGYLGISAEL